MMSDSGLLAQPPVLATHYPAPIYLNLPSLLACWYPAPRGLDDCLSLAYTREPRLLPPASRALRLTLLSWRLADV